MSFQTPLDEQRLFHGTAGSRTADIFILTDTWDYSEHKAQVPFVNAAGGILERLLRSAKTPLVDCFRSTLFPLVPPGNQISNWFELDPSGPLVRELYPTKFALDHVARIWQQIELVKPKLIIALGNYAFWALSDEVRSGFSDESGGRRVPLGIGDFNGSMLFAKNPLTGNEYPLLPINSPQTILKSWELLAPTAHMLSMRIPQALSNAWSPVTQTEVKINPTYPEAFNYLTNLLSTLNLGRKTKISHDIETRQQLITCMGFALNAKSAFVFPFLRKQGFELVSYWTPREELILSRLFCKILSHENAQLIGQNYLYDMTYIHRFYGIQSLVFHDTMSSQHLIWPGTQKDLGYLSSLYCKHHRYWKDDNKEWDAKGDLDRHFRYNGEDCLRTFEIHERQLEVMTEFNILPLWEKELLKHSLAFEMSTSGIKINLNQKAELALTLSAASQERVNLLLKIVPQKLISDETGKEHKVLWPTSTAQQKVLFYDILQMSGQRHRKTGQPTLDKEALPKLKRKYPHFSRIFDLLLELRSIDVFASTFVNARVDADKRMRTSFNPAGTETFRWSSSRNPFGTGGNFQNLPKGKDL